MNSYHSSVIVFILEKRYIFSVLTIDLGCGQAPSENFHYNFLENGALLSNIIFLSKHHEMLIISVQTAGKKMYSQLAMAILHNFLWTYCDVGHIFTLNICPKCVNNKITPFQ
ncbi:hypothetical protein WA026_008282 [Henosepilachna vigintioctopunctata]|uniref:Uncharacterized protein n=1 Tax=Henosepilachna vigintioctopunctata TaxID=420089 RepID=A0AAW1TRH4_9CUCU